MVLKHALLLTNAGIPLFSFDFRRGKLHVDSVLFSGLISAIHTFVDDVIVPDKESNIGFITSSDMDVMYCKGKQVISVLVGNELKKDFEERLRWITITVDDSIDVDLVSLNNDDDRAVEIANMFKYQLVNAFNSQSIQGYHTPVRISDTTKENDFTSKSPHKQKFTSFLSTINNKLTLFEIHEFTNLSWIELKMMTSELVSAHLIVLKTEIHDEQIFKLTVKGMDMMFELEDIPKDLMQVWDTAIAPFLSRIDQFTSFGEIKELLVNSLSPRDMYQLESSIPQLLSKEIIKPLSSLVQLGIFLQQYYLHFYQYLMGRVGHKGEKIFMEKINRNRYIKLTLPDFTNNKIQSTDKIYHILRRSTIEENTTLIAQSMLLIRDTIDALSDQISPDVKFDLQETIWNESKIGNELLVEKYGLNDIYCSIVSPLS